MWLVYKEANRPFPQLTDDDYIDFCICESLAARAAKLAKDAAKAQQLNEWKKQPVGSGGAEAVPAA